MTELTDLLYPENRRVDLWDIYGNLVVKDLILIPDTKVIPHGIRYGARVFFLNNNSGKYIEGYLYTDQNNYAPGSDPMICEPVPPSTCEESS